MGHIEFPVLNLLLYEAVSNFCLACGEVIGAKGRMSHPGNTDRSDQASSMVLGPDQLTIEIQQRVSYGLLCEPPSSPKLGRQQLSQQYPSTSLIR